MNPRLLALAASALVATACAAPPAQSDPPIPQISDADLVAYAAKPFDKAAMMFKHLSLGMNHGLMVVADFPCGDICPDYTSRIIHYALDPGPACVAAGGAVVSYGVPVSIAVMQKPFCVPKVLAEARR